MFTLTRRFGCAFLLAMGMASMLACARPTAKQQTDPVQEVIAEVDVYRQAEGFRPISEAKSDDPVYMALGDRPSTAGLQFDGPIARIALSDVVLITLKNNREIRIEQQNRSIAEDAIEGAKGIYDLLVAASYDYQNVDRQTPNRVDTESSRNGLAVSKSRSGNVSLSLQQLLPTGGIVSLFATNYYNNTRGIPDSLTGLGPINPYDSVALGVSISQPLLRNFGPYVTNAPIRIARLRNDIAFANFYDAVNQQINNALRLYWDLVFSINNYEVQQLSLERAQELLRVARIKRDTGVEPPNIVLQAEAEVARRDALVIDARRTIADVQDALKRVMNISETSDEWRYNLIPVDGPSYNPISPNEQAVYAEALQLRPDYRAALLGTDIAEINRRVAKNRRLPQLDVVGSYQITGLEKNLGESIDNLETGDFETWDAGLRFSYPLQNRTARAQYRQSETQLDQQHELVRNLEDVIRLEVRMAIRAIETNLKLIDAYESSVRAEQSNLDAQRKRYEVGFTTIFEVIQFQENLATAQVNYIRAIVNYNKAMVELERIRAALLKDYRIEVMENTPRGPMVPGAKSLLSTKVPVSDLESIPPALEGTRAMETPQPVAAPKKIEDEEPVSQPLPNPQP